MKRARTVVIDVESIPLDLRGKFERLTERLVERDGARSLGVVTVEFTFLWDPEAGEPPPRWHGPGVVAVVDRDG